MLAELAATASKDSLQGLLTDCRNTGNQMSVQIKNLMRDTTKMGNSIRQYQSMLNVNMTEQEKLNALLNQKNIDVFIEGHTDNKPINTVQFKDNWDLSVIRATSVVRILIKNYNVNPLQIQPSGRGEYMPVDDNETAEGRSKNRRTEIIMAPKLDKLFQMLQSTEE